MSDFHVLDRALTEAGVPLDAATCHGGLCGLLCMRPVDADTLWLKETLARAEGGSDEIERCRGILSELHRETAAALEDPLLGFAPLLPDDEEDLVARTEALGRWCQGFLYGLGSGGLDDADLRGEAREAVRDLAEVAKAGVGGEDADCTRQELEVAYTEVVEYLRVAVQTVFEDRNPRRGPLRDGCPPLH